MILEQHHQVEPFVDQLLEPLLQQTPPPAVLVWFRMEKIEGAEGAEGARNILRATEVR